jgi:hypothetical protein
MGALDRKRQQLREYSAGHSSTAAEFLQELMCTWQDVCVLIWGGKPAAALTGAG